MLLIERPQTDPYFNLAAEEYLLRTLEQDCFMLWINEPSVVVGKHQNAFAEIDAAFIESHNIPVIRRISGGGTVFHDPGNLNFTFIQQGKQESLVDFRRFTQPIIDFLNSLGIPAQFEGKNDIRVNGLKVSGNAEHVYKNRVLHHGTLLFSSELNSLNSAIRGKEALFSDKAVRSVRSKVANIVDFLKVPMTVESFRQGILDHIRSVYREARTIRLSEHQLQEIGQLAADKYKTWDWNFGYSPKCTFHKSVPYRNNSIELTLEVKNGKIQEVRSDRHSGMFQWMEGLPFRQSDLLDELTKKQVKDKQQETDLQSILQILFK